MAKQFKPGINHMEFWVKDLKESAAFYSRLFEIIGWNKLNERAFSTGVLEIYFCEVEAELKDSLGVRHICFQATSEEMVNEVGRFLEEIDHPALRGPQYMPYSEKYYTVDFKDPNGFVLEVAYTPNMVM